MMTQPVKNRRSGVSLVETLVAVTIGSLLFGMTLVLLQSVLRADVTSRRHLRQVQTLSRLSELFRSDVHAASKAALEQEGQQLRLAVDEVRAVTYTISQGRVRREVRVQDAVQHRDEFDLVGITPSFVVSGEDDDMVELTITEEIASAAQAAHASDGYRPRMLLRMRAELNYHASQVSAAR